MPTLVFWVDVDNTLLDNDLVKKTEDQFLQNEVGPALTKHYWDFYESVRKERGLVDIPLTLTRFRENTSLDEMNQQTYLRVYKMIMHYPFQQALYPQARETLRHLSSMGTTAIVSDGDWIYQTDKILSSGLADEVDGRVLLYTHKQEHLEEIARSWPADHCVMVDDKPAILVDLKHLLGNKITTVFVRQGKYANTGFPVGLQPDIIVDHVGDLLHFTAEQFLAQCSAAIS